jgi:hypothetical protein
MHSLRGLVPTAPPPIKARPFATSSCANDATASDGCSFDRRPALHDRHQRDHAGVILATTGTKSSRAADEFDGVPALARAKRPAAARV